MTTRTTHRSRIAIVLVEETIVERESAPMKAAPEAAPNEKSKTAPAQFPGPGIVKAVPRVKPAAGVTGQ